MPKTTYGSQIRYVLSIFSILLALGSGAGGSLFAQSITISVDSVVDATCANTENGAINITVSGGTPDYSYEWTGPDSYNQTGVEDISGLQAGVYTITVRDQSLIQQSESRDITININDTEAPVFANIPADQLNVDMDSGACGAIITWNDPIASDNCDGSINVVRTDATGFDSGDLIPVGTHTISYSATDAAGNVQTASFQISVKADAEKPVFANIPADQLNVDMDSGACGAIITWNDPTASDNCDGSINVVRTDATGFDSGDLIPVGTHTISYSATDAAGNVQNASFQISVKVDAEKPVFANIPADQLNADMDSGACGAIITWNDPTASDNCDGSINVVRTDATGFDSGDLIPVGTHTISYSATDAAGNVQTASFQISVKADAEKPVFANIPADQLNVDMDSGACGAIITWNDPTASDNCDGSINVVRTDATGFDSGDLIPVGTHTISYSATDAAGNVQNASFQISVQADAEKPVFANIPADQLNVDMDSGACGAIITWNDPTASDNCDGSINVVRTDATGFDSGDLIPVGTHTISYSATDAAGNVQTASFQISVKADAEKPVFANIPADQLNVDMDSGACGAIITWNDPTASDNCDGSINVVRTDATGFDSGDLIPVGTHTISYSATDAAGNVQNASFQISVQADAEKPVFANIPADQLNVDMDSGACGAIITWNDPTASDNCDGSINVVRTDATGFDSGDLIPVGTHTISYSATDAEGNVQTASFQISVQADAEKPVFANIPADQLNVDMDSGACGAIITWNDPTASDNCDGSINVVRTDATGFDSGDLIPVGTHTISYSATDAAGNVQTASFQISVKADAEKPVFANIPADQLNMDMDSGACGAIITWNDPTASDNCDGSINVVRTDATGFDSGDLIPVGTHTISYSATDAAGNVQTASFQISVKADAEKPVFANIPADQLNVDMDSGACGAIITWNDPTASDNCDGSINVVRTDATGFDSGDLIPVGTHTISYSATDAAGNVQTASFQISVKADAEKPVFANIPADQLNVDMDSGACGAIITWNDPTASDNCDGSINVVRTDATGFDSGDLIPVGTHTISYSATDAEGNVQNASFQISVKADAEKPVFANIPADQLNVDMDSGACGAIITWNDPTASDNCDGSINVVRTDATGFASGDLIPVGTHTISYSATDAAGNVQNASFQISVKADAEPPSVICPNPNESYSADAGECDATLSFTATATDNCDDNVAISYSVDNTNITFPYNFPVGTTEVIVTADDGDINSANTTCTFDVTVIDNELPSITCIPNQEEVTDEGECFYTVQGTEYDPVNYSDNCNILSVTNDFNNSSTLDGAEIPHDTTITWTVTDTSDNIQTCSFTVTVEDNQAPDIPELEDVVGECPLIVDPPTTTDNCGEIITGTTGLADLTFSESETIFWIFTDAAGNTSDPVEQRIIVEDTSPPVPDVDSLPKKVINGCQVTDISELDIPTATDACEGEIKGTLGEEFEFPFIFTGTKTITWKYVDSNEIETLQSQEIQIVPVTINGGTITGTFESTDYENQVNLAACGERITVELELKNEAGDIIQWEKFAENDGEWRTISNLTNNHTVIFEVGELESTKYRVLTQEGSCTKYSNTFKIRALPAGDAPTVENLDNKTYYCYEENVNLLATSNYVVTQETIADQAGEFETGQINTNDPDGWLVDGEVGGFSCGGNNAKTRNWSCTGTNTGGNPPGHKFGNITYFTGSKISLAQGDYFELNNQGDPVYTDGIPSTLETPILDFTNAQSAYLNFDQAYNFVASDIAVIEISLDGGETYTQVLRTLHAEGSSPSNWLDDGNWEGKNNSTSTYFNFLDDNTSISLQDYLGQSQVRIRWSFTGTSDESIWALDNIFVNKEVIVNTDLEWTVGIGDPDEDPIEVGRTSIELNFVPESPGYHQYGGTSLINDCRTYSEEGTGLIDIFVSYSYAGEDIILGDDGCGLNTVQLNAYDNTKTANQNAAKGAYPNKPDNCLTCDNPGSGEIGVWSWNRTSGTCEEVEEKFSDINDPDATFTGNAGTYVLTWTVGGHRADACSSSLIVEITDCDQVDFDGTNDYIDFGTENFNLSGTNNKKAFSIEVWVKPETINGTQTIFSKRDLNSTANRGYDLRITNGEVSFNWDKTGFITSTHKINSNRWYHIALTHSFDGEYKLYIDGVFITRTGGGAPGSNTSNALLGAMHNLETRIPENYFNGWMEEFRVWDVALDQADIRLMMNQRIRKDNGKIIGEVLPLNISTLDWSSLIGYYRFENISCGNVLPYNDGTNNKGPNGWLKNITSPQQKSAPLPYISEADGNWRVRSTWDANIGTAGANWWDVPNGEGVNGEYINWNIVETKHDITHNIAPSYPSNVNLLALISSSKTLKMDGDYNNETGLGLTISKYLELNGVIDLNGNSQLVQPEGSILVESSSGYIDIDQQGTANSFNYNYWTSPVSLIGEANNYGYKIGDVLWSGTNNITGPINFNFQYHWADGNYTGDKRISTYWLYIFNESESSSDLSSVEDEYFKWIQISESTLLNPGFGFSMKGTSGAVPISTIQNYTFRGKPNNGNIYVSAGVDQNLLTGNPYPSALNAEEFINDNAINEKNFNGALYFWDHFGRVNSHYLEHYIGGYAVYTKAGAVSPATSSDYRINNETTEKGTKKPGKYIPVGQGFFVSTNGASISSPTQLKFKNSQRAFVPESTNDSQFHQQEPGKGQREKSEYTQDNRFKIRLKLESPKGYHRQILVTADGNTTSGFDIGYDAPLIENNVEDMYWIIEEKAFVIQGVPDFNLDRVLPIGIKIAEAGTYTIKVDELENLDKNFTVFLKDKETGKYHDLTRSDFTVTTEETGRFNEKYEVVFTHPDMVKPKPEVESDGSPIGAGYYKDSDELFIQNPELMKIDRVELYSVSGQKVMTFNDVATDVRTTLKIRQKLSSAVYIVKVYSEKRTYSRKVIITK